MSITWGREYDETCDVARLDKHGMLWLIAKDDEAQLWCLSVTVTVPAENRLNARELAVGLAREFLTEMADVLGATVTWEDEDAQVS